MARRALFSTLVLGLAILGPLPLSSSAQQVPSAAPPAEVLTNAVVVKMVEAKLSDELIIAKIRTSTCSFETSLDAILKLKGASVSDAVIQAMVEAGAATKKAVEDAASPAGPPPPDLNDPLAPHDSGIYWYAKEKREKQLVQLEPTLYSSAKTAGVFASRMTYGLAKAKVKVVVNSARANLRISESVPEFWFYFEQKSHGLGPYSPFIPSASSPNEFVLARMEAKKNNRELVMVEAGAYSASVGMREQDNIPLTFEKIAPGIYKVLPRNPLAPGEYCFFHARTINQVSKLFDFGIDPAR